MSLLITALMRSGFATTEGLVAGSVLSRSLCVTQHTVKPPSASSRGVFVNWLQQCQLQQSTYLCIMEISSLFFPHTPQHSRFGIRRNLHNGEGRHIILIIIRLNVNAIVPRIHAAKLVCMNLTVCALHRDCGGFDINYK